MKETTLYTFVLCDNRIIDMLYVTYYVCVPQVVASMCISQE